MVLDPLVAAGADVDVYACLHSAPALNDHVLQMLRPVKYHFETDPTKLQGAQVATGIALIEPDNYDLVVVLRLDLLFKVG